MGLNFEDQFDAGGGMLVVGVIFFLAFLANCLGITNSDEKELFDDEAFEAREERELAAQAQAKQAKKKKKKKKKQQMYEEDSDDDE